MNKRTVIFISVCLCGILVFFFRNLLLTEAGYAVEARSLERLSPTRSEAVLIPNADYIANDTCTAMLEQADSLSEANGGVPIFMTCYASYGISGCELAANAAARDGLAITLRRIDTHKLQDTEEAGLALQKLKESNVRVVAVVLPNYKTRRLGGSYRKVASRLGMEVMILPSVCRGFDARTWWTGRESQKLLAFELIRRVAGF